MLIRDFLRPLCIVLLLGTSFVRPANAQVLEQSFSDTVAGFKISTPNSRWSFEPRGSAPGPQRAVIIFESSLHQFVPNVSVRVTQTLDANQEVDDFFQKEIEGLPPTAQILTKKKINLGTLKGQELSWKEPDSGVLFLQWFFVSKQRQFILTCAAKEDSYTRLLPDFRLILNSFQLL